MNRTLNATLITLLSFFVFLAALVYLTGPSGGPPADDNDDNTSTRTTTTTSAAPVGPEAVPSDALNISDVTAEWRSGDGGAAVLQVEITVQNTHDGPVNVANVTYDVTFNGDPVRHGVWVGGVVPANSTATVGGPVPFNEVLTRHWWHAFTQSDGSPQVQIRGAVQPHDIEPLAFSWQGSAQSDLHEELAQAAENCGGDQGDAAVCVERSTLEWRDDRLVWHVRFRHDGDHNATLRDIRVALSFGGIQVSRASLDDIAFGPHEEVERTVRLDFDPDAIGDWWAQHALDCESSRADLRFVSLQQTTEPAERQNGSDDNASSNATVTDSQIVDWTFTAPQFETQLACARGA